MRFIAFLALIFVIACIIGSCFIGVRLTTTDGAEYRNVVLVPNPSSEFITVSNSIGQFTIPRSRISISEQKKLARTVLSPWERLKATFEEFIAMKHGKVLVVLVSALGYIMRPTNEKSVK